MDIAALTVKQALADLKAKKYNCVELVDSCFTKIDFWEPKIKAFISQKRKLALRQAAESDFRYQNGTSRLLEGIPIAVKDNFNIQGW
ncbi:MAG: Asp-tRNA(Asn)/Glu-tRNA(Gln) amidotransferase GatCAB subunit A, partial [Candidatus Portnoybacteria bacterium CG03_land_8_20_14_0_80_41_10]